MADEFEEKKPSNRPSLLNTNQDITNQSPTHLLDPGSESAFTGSWGSSSSFLNTSFGSELDSSETDNDDGDDEFIAELTRRMADYMLQEDDDGDNNNDKNTPPEDFVAQKPISQVENQSRIGQNSRRGRRGKMTESTQQMRSYRGGRVYPVGSGMRAIFLDGPGTRNGSNGTGVFLPRSAAQSRRKPGCSTALVPTRVLQVLQHHFNNMEYLSHSNNLVQTHRNHHGQRGGMQPMRLALSDHLERELPQEWTY